ncbi:hypothetical protein MRX96_039835 [Rhipicephalus microplus]
MFAGSRIRRSHCSVHGVWEATTRRHRLGGGPVPHGEGPLSSVIVHHHTRRADHAQTQTIRQEHCSHCRRLLAVPRGEKRCCKGGGHTGGRISSERTLPARAAAAESGREGGAETSPTSRPRAHLLETLVEQVLRECE